MADAAIFIDGKVRQTTNLTGVTFNSKTGFVANFTFNQIKYVHVYKDKFNNGDANSKNASAGYYDESQFLKYLVHDGVSVDDLPAAKLNLGKIPSAKEKDKVRVQYFRVKAPYTDFCTVDKYSWDFDPNAKVLDDVHFNIILQPGYSLDPEKITLSAVPNDFYAKNITLVTSSDFTDDKNSGAYYLSLIALQIERINKDIFPLFYPSNSLSVYIADQNLEWRTGNIFIKPSLQDIIDYYINLTSFYNVAYANQVLIAAASEATKLFWLANCLSASGLSVFSVDDKIYIIVQAIKESKAFALVNVANNLGSLIGAGTSLTESDAEWVSNITPKLILKIVESVTLVETQCDAFLKNLNTIGIYGISKDETLFEVIYNFLGDNQVGNIIGDNKVGRIVGGIFGNADDRRNFMNFLLSIWQTSIYNPYYPSPTYTLPANEDNVFPESYYMTDSGAAHYNGENATVLFVSENRYDVISFTQSFNFSIERSKIIAYEKTTTIVYVQGQAVRAPVNDLYGIYDLYQPISITGFQPDLDISMPNTNCFPLFFLYFAIDYKDVKDADALIELAINVALNFTGIGEVADLEYLTYLKQISKFNAIEDMEASKALLTWRAVRGINEAVQFNAGNALAISNYLNTTTTDPGLKEFTSYLDTFLGAVLLGSVCFHPIIKGKVTFAAKQVTEAYDGLPAELKSLLTLKGVSPDNIGAIRVFSDDVAAAKILRFSDSKELRTAILALDDANLIRFLNDYGEISDDLVTILKDNPDVVQNWLNLTEVEKEALKNIPETWIKSIYTFRAKGFNNFCFLKIYSPVVISDIARIFPTVKANSYLQVEFRWSDNGFKYEVRAHTEIPNSPGVGNGSVWVAKRKIISDGTFDPYEEVFVDGNWIRGYVWFDLIEKQKQGIITDAEKLILKNGHYKAK